MTQQNRILLDSKERVEWPEVVVAMATFRRPDCLTRILPALAHQVTDYPGAATVLVVDNDPNGGARPAVLGWRGHRVRYVHEPTPGIAAARNRALGEAGRAELLVFIDDDELPLGDWLQQLVDCWRTYCCVAVAGPVLARFEGTADPWAARSGVFDRVRRDTGTLLAGAATNNLLLHLPQLRALEVVFDEQFGLSGGSDSMLTHTLVSRGAEIRWCDEAEVLDFIPASRISRTWVLRRSYRTGNGWSRVALALADGPAARLWQRVELTARGVVRGGQGLVRWAGGVLSQDLGRRASGSCMVATGLGVVAGAAGLVVVEYGRPVAGSVGHRHPGRLGRGRAA